MGVKSELRVLMLVLSSLLMLLTLLLTGLLRYSSAITNILTGLLVSFVMQSLNYASRLLPTPCHQSPSLIVHQRRNRLRAE